MYTITYRYTNVQIFKELGERRFQSTDLALIRTLYKRWIKNPDMTNVKAWQYVDGVQIPLEIK